MKVYTVLIKDRHTDPTIKLFANKQKAMEYAQSYLRDNVDKEDPDYPEIYEAGKYWFATYSSEGDYVRVEESEII